MHMALLIWAEWEVTKISTQTVSSEDCKLINITSPFCLQDGDFCFGFVNLKYLHYDYQT